MSQQPKERPMLFSAPMVRAILDGSKTQTRRVMKVPPKKDFSWYGGYAIISKAVSVALNIFNRAKGVPIMGDATPCPYGKPGDRFWVREAFSVTGFSPSVEYHTEAGNDADCAACRVKYHADGTVRNIVELSTDNGLGVNEEEQALRGSKKKSVPSIHMPRWASRINLEITGVRVERLNDISEADAKAEGCQPADCCHAYYHGFTNLWESINGAGSWSANPWVWVIEFKVVKP